MSGTSDIFGLYFALFAVNLCTYLIVWWIADSKDVDQKVDETKLKFKVYDLYNYCRNDISKLKFYYAAEVVFTMICSLILTSCLFDLEETGAMNDDGQAFGLLFVGLTLMFIIVF